MSRARQLIMEFFDVGPVVALTALVVTTVVLLAAGLYIARSAGRRAELRCELDRIEVKIHRTRIRPAFVDQYYNLRGHIGYVRGVVERAPA